MVAALCHAGSSGPVRPRPGVTMLLQFDSDHSPESIEEMKRELRSIMKASRLTFDYKLRSELAEEDSPSDLIIVRFRGRCRMQNLPALLDERGPLAITHSSDGEILPFSEIACDRVRVTVQSAMWGDDHRQGDMLLGRALGRVIAHEVWHILTNTRGHGTKGVAKAALSGRQLIEENLELDAADLERMLTAEPH